jgi:hypothetical protein
VEENLKNHVDLCRMLDIVALEKGISLSTFLYIRVLSFCQYPIITYNSLNFSLFMSDFLLPIINCLSLFQNYTPITHISLLPF